jgi:hypothetical protein
MHEVVSLYFSWSASLYVWARTVVGIVLWFWVVSGAIFGLRFLVFVLLENQNAPSALAAGSGNMPFAMKSYQEDPRANSTQE